jgi:hypothetical protein
MFIEQLSTSDSAVQLVEPNIERDAALGVSWLAGDSGRMTLKLMGVTDEDNRASTLNIERQRVAEFLRSKEQYNWMISASGKIVGSAWVDLKPTKYIQAPAISIMLGDPESRSKGIGGLVFKTVTEFLEKQGHGTIYARHLIENDVSKSLLARSGFVTDGEQYTDGDGLRWQNAKRDLK